MGVGQLLWLTMKRVMGGVVIGVTISDRFGTVATMSGRSMEPTLHPGSHGTFGRLESDIVLLERLCLRGYSFSRGDVVAFRSPGEPGILMVKRLIALQGDWVTVPGSYDILQVPKGHCWVEGDNAEVSFDSRAFGPIPLALMHGRVTHVIWPPARFGAVPQRVPEDRIIKKKT